MRFFLDRFFKMGRTKSQVKKQIPSHFCRQEVLYKKSAVPVKRKNRNLELLESTTTKDKDVKPVVPKIPTELSRAGLEFLEYNEGFRAKAYYDSVGVLTIGIGTSAPEYKRITGQTLTSNTTITKEVAYDLMQKWFISHGIFKLLIDAGLEEQHIFDALCSFAYNVGKGGLVNKYAPKHMYTAGFGTQKLSVSSTYIEPPAGCKNIIDLIKNNAEPVNIACCMSWWRRPSLIRKRRGREIDMVLK